MTGTDTMRAAAARTGVAVWTGTGARLLLAGVLGYAGLVKVSDLTEAGRTVALYRLVPPETAQLIGGALPLVELALALLLAVGLATRATAALSAALMVVYIAAITSVWARGMSIDCGCFSSGSVVTSGAEWGYAVDIARDLVFLAAAGYLVRYPRTLWSLDGKALMTKEM